jgi:aminoglycoside/choline kinase family phosphotransferase
MDRKDVPRIHAMVLAAGEGNRLRPVTARLPKPLLPLRERPLLDIILANLRRTGVAKFAVNAHHLPEPLAAMIATLSFAADVQIFPERELLGTGGALVNARGLLAAADLFLLHNGDILSDLDLGALVQAHCGSGALATMVLFDGPENRVLFGPDGAIGDILGKLGADPVGSSLLTYAGIAAFSPAIFAQFPDRPARFSLVEALLPVIAAQPGAIRGFRMPPDTYWNDLGTVAKFLAAAADAAAGRCRLPRRRVSRYPSSLMPLAEQGSNRQFSRLQAGTEIMVLMRSGPEDPDFARFLEIGAFLHELHLGVPEIHAARSDEFTVLMEDLGDDTLHRLIRKTRRTARVSGGDPWAEIVPLYRRVLGRLAEMQVRATRALADRPSGFLRTFDHAYLRWETDYFRDRFLRDWLHLPAAELAALTPEFDALAAAALAQPQVFIHRDFQSQNILIQDGVVRLVDFQGARLGQVAYDLMSLLRDPYVALPRRIQAGLVDDFRLALAAVGGPAYAPAELAKFAAVAGLQRGMQVLGAYVFLSKVKGKTRYARFIAPGLRLLRQSLHDFNALPDPPCRLPRLSAIMAGTAMPRRRKKRAAGRRP